MGKLPENLNLLVEYLKGYLDRMDGIKIAVVMDTPQITSTILLGRKMKQLHIRPFTTRDAAMSWIAI